MSGDALIGHTGFVGGSLLAQRAFAAVFNSSNIEEIRGRQFDRIYCAGAPGVKWKANREPEADRASIERLEQALAHARCRHLILLSTVDVYPKPVRVDELSTIDESALAPYGKHRFGLEQFARRHFDATVIRLPGLFGPGLKKNVIFDLLHSNQVEAINAASEFQFYDMRGLSGDIDRAVALGVPIANFATEPVAVADLAREAFGIVLGHRDMKTRQRYDMHTRYASALGGYGAYMVDAVTTLARIADYVQSEGWPRS